MSQEISHARKALTDGVEIDVLDNSYERPQEAQLCYLRSIAYSLLAIAEASERNLPNREKS